MTTATHSDARTTLNFIFDLLVPKNLARRRLYVYCASLLALSLTACTTTPPIIIPPSATETLTDVPQAWVRDFPADLNGVRLHAYEDCLFVTGRKRQGSQSLRTQLCMEPLTGDIRWVHERPIQSDAQQVDEYLFADQHLIYANRQSVTVIRRSDGKQVWTFEDKDSRAIFRTSMVGDNLLLSLGNETLAMIQIATGKRLGQWSMEGRALKQAALTASGPVAVLIQAPQGDQEQALLQGAL